MSSLVSVGALIAHGQAEASTQILYRCLSSSFHVAGKNLVLHIRNSQHRYVGLCKGQGCTIIKHAILARRKIKMIAASIRLLICSLAPLTSTGCVNVMATKARRRFLVRETQKTFFMIYLQPLNLGYPPTCPGFSRIKWTFET